MKRIGTVEQPEKYPDVKVDDLFLMSRGRGIPWIHKVVKVSPKQFELRSITARDGTVGTLFWKQNGNRVARFGAEWIERPATEEDVAAFHQRLAADKSAHEKNQQRLEEMKQKRDDIIAPLLSSPLGQSVSAQFYEDHYELSLSHLTEEQAKRVVSLLAQVKI